MSTTSGTSIDEQELMDCIRALVLLSTDDDGGIEAVATDGSSSTPASAATSVTGSSDDYQKELLTQEVEEKLIAFLEEQVRRDDNTTNSTSENDVGPDKESDKIVLPIYQPHAYPCENTNDVLPSLPSKWPQGPVMIRPTPGTSTKIRGIRYARDRDYRHFSGFCAGCILPVNNGQEEPGKSLVVDFESTHFVGTLLLRIKGVPSAEKDSPSTNEKKKSYFDNRKRKFTGIVKGKFKTPLPMSECVTGQTFGRKAGEMPAKWVVSTFIKFVSALAPQLETTLEGDNPRFLVPLSATAHTVIAKPHKTVITQQKDLIDQTQELIDDHLFNASVYLGATDIEADIHEPPASDATSVMQELPKELGGSSASSAKSSIASRMKARKKAFNAVSAKQSKVPCFSLDKEYTFEFYQHLLVFDEPEFVLDMGRPIGKVPLSPITDGQPIKFMSAHKDPTSGKLDSLWSFDVWHESMYALAQKATEKRKR